ncbi:MAG: type IVB secretion system lipoprotein DotD [Legionellaceae bacterium]|nr:type IVB secretion system lipoprotein DotD [Legionellaceae bacterium]
MNNKLIVLFLSFLIVSGCASTTFKRPPNNDPSDDATIKLAEAANSVSDSMMQMAKTEKVLTDPRKDNVINIPNTANLQEHASVDWSGPIAELTAQIAKAAHYRILFLGNSPTIPILISVNLKDHSLAEILRNIDYQAGNKASIHVYPKSKVVELRYVNTYS